jgi:plasmid stabilization system protein ParE
MTVKLRIAPEAARDIDEAYSWYESQRVGLGEDFLSCVDACLQAICRRPEMHEKVHQDYRRGLIRRFPYAIYYEYDHSAVTVYCVFHTSRDPDKWRKRLP